MSEKLTPKEAKKRYLRWASDKIKAEPKGAQERTGERARRFSDTPGMFEGKGRIKEAVVKVAPFGVGEKREYEAEEQDKKWREKKKSTELPTLDPEALKGPGFVEKTITEAITINKRGRVGSNPTQLVYPQDKGLRLKFAGGLITQKEGESKKEFEERGRRSMREKEEINYRPEKITVWKVKGELMEEKVSAIKKILDPTIVGVTKTKIKELIQQESSLGAMEHRKPTAAEYPPKVSPFKPGTFESEIDVDKIVLKAKEAGIERKKEEERKRIEQKEYTEERAERKGFQTGRENLYCEVCGKKLTGNESKFCCKQHRLEYYRKHRK